MATPFVVADGAVAVAADFKQYDTDMRQKEAETRSSGSRLANALRSDFGRVLSAGAGLAFAGMSRGLSELDEVQRRFAADTGATADEAKRAGDAILEMSRRNLAPLSEIGDALGKVHTDLGLTGEAAERTTEQFVRFGLVTKQSGAEEVKAFDDILDAWGETADAIPSIMDRLVASHQQYGGAIDEDEAALAAMAPQLKAFNLGIDDGIALLNLFKASGLNAAQIPRALNSAIQQLDGRPIQDVVRELAAIEDPGERAQRAMEIFGSRAGAGLANAIQPGMDSLDAFKISTEEAAGAADRAADEIESGFGNQVKLALKNFGGAALQAGRDVGPLLLALSSLGSFAHALKLDVGIQKSLQKIVGSGLVKSAAGRAGAFVGIAFEAGANLASRIGGGIDAVRTSSLVRTAADKTGSFLGTRIGKAASVAFSAVIVLEAARQFKETGDALAGQAEGFGADIASQIAGGTTEQLQQSKGALLAAIKSIVSDPWKLAIAGDALAVMRGQLEQIDAELASRADDSATLVVRAAERAERSLQDETPAMRQAAEQFADQLPTALEKRAIYVANNARNFLALPVVEQLLLIGPEGIRAGAATALGLASGLRDKRSEIEAAFDQLGEDIKTALSPKQIIGHDTGLLIGRRLARALQSTNPVVKAQAEGTRALIEAELIETVRAGGEAGEAIQRELEQKLHSKDPAVRAQAERTKALIDAALKEQPAKTPGEAIAGGLARDLQSGTGPIGRVAYTLGRTIATNLLRGVRGDGYVAPSTSTVARRIGGVQEYAEGTSYVPADMLAYLHKGEIVVPPAESERIRQGFGTMGGGDTYDIDLHMPDATNRDPFAVLERASRLARWGQLKPAPTNG